MRKFLWLFLLFPSAAFGQGARFDGVAQRTIQNFLAPIPGAQITVCTAAGTGTPCTPLASIFLDAGLTQPASNPFTADSNGNFGFWAAASTTYKYSITATGVTGQLFTVVLPIVGGGAGTFTNLTVSGTVSPNTVGGVFYVCSGCTNTTLASAVTAAVALGGGIIYDTNPETFTADPFASINNVTATPVHVFLGHGVWKTNVQITPATYFSRLQGAGEWSGNGGTAIQANAGSFPSQSITAASEVGNEATYTVGSTANIAVNSMVSISGVTVGGYNQSCIADTVTATQVSCAIKASGLGASSGGTLSAAIVRIGRDNQTHGAWIQWLTLDCANIAGCAGISASDPNEYSGARDISILNTPSYGIDIESSTGGSAQGNVWQNIEISPGNGGTANTQGFRYVGNGGGCPGTMDNINAVGTVGHSEGFGFFIANCLGLNASNLHSEQTGIGIQLGDTTLGAVGGAFLRKPTCGPNCTSEGVLINNNSTVDFDIFNSTTTAATNILDTPRSFTITDSVVPAYMVGHGALGLQPIYSTSNVTGNTLNSTTFVGNVVFKTVFAQWNETTGNPAAPNVDICQGNSTFHMLACNYNNGSTALPLPLTGNTAGTHSDSGFFQTAGAAGCTTAASIGGVCATAITVTWPVAFADANYKVVCTPIGPATNLPSNPYVVTPIAASVTINYFAITAAAASWPTVNCTAVHN